MGHVPLKKTDDCEVTFKQKTTLSEADGGGGSVMYVFKVEIVRSGKSPQMVEVHYKPNVAKGKWRIGKTGGGDMEDFADKRLEQECLDKKRG